LAYSPPAIAWSLAHSLSTSPASNAMSESIQNSCSKPSCSARVAISERVRSIAAVAVNRRTS
jgi:hypothetical protein